MKQKIKKFKDEELYPKSKASKTKKRAMDKFDERLEPDFKKIAQKLKK
ncbi:MAG: hypothetical protein JXR62_06755 [Bacilli bacterium]|nr:hypothetical protein [Bacilli bacterium]